MRGVSAVALKLLAAVLFGVLVGLDRSSGARKRALLLSLAAALSGFLLGLAWVGFAPEDWALNSIWVELSAACCVYALGFGGDEPSLWDEEDRRAAFALGLAQSVAFAFANAVGAWAYALGYLLLVAGGHLLDYWISCALEPDESLEPRSAGAATLFDRVAKPARPDWLDEAPRSFIAALNAACRAEPAPIPDSSSPAHRQIRVVHNVAKPLDARSAANTRPIGRAHGKEGRHKSPKEARDPAHGRR
jgi:hypothetical protein